MAGIVGISVQRAQALAQRTTHGPRGADA